MAVGATPVAIDIVQALDEGAEITCVWSGWGCGKTRAVIQAAYWLCMTREVYDPQDDARSPMRVLITAESMTKLRQNMMLEADEEFGNLEGARHFPDPMFPRWEFENGAQIVFRNFTVYPSGKNSIEGQKFSAVFSDETQELNVPEWAKVSLARSRLPNVHLGTGARYSGQVVWCGYPQSDDRYLREAKERERRGSDVRFVYRRSGSNPWVGGDYEERMRRNFATEEEWEAACQIRPGLTFPSPTSYYGSLVSRGTYPEGSLIDLPLDPDYPTIASIDPGNNSYSVCLWQMHEVEGELKAVLVQEWMPDTDAYDQDAIEFLRPWNLTKVIIDPFASNQRGRQAAGRSTAALYARRPDENPDGLGGGLGVEVVARLGARGGVADGVSRVRARLRDIDGNRDILIRRELWESPEWDRGVRFSLSNYKPGPDGQPLKKRGSASETASHCCDAIRYFVVSEIYNGIPQPDPTPIPARVKVRPAFGYSRGR